MRVEGRLAGSNELPLHEAFEGINDDLFALMHLHDFEGFPRIRAALPTWPNGDLWKRVMGSASPNDSLKEAVAFWVAVRGDFLRITGRSIANTRVVDYGAGWGRITRMISKDVPVGQLWAIDPNEELLECVRTCSVKTQVIQSDWDSNVPLSVRDAGLMVSFGVFSHSSAPLTRNMFARLAEISSPGALLAITVRPGALLHADRGEAEVFSKAEIIQAREDYLKGKHVFVPYEPAASWGVAVAPSECLSSLSGGAFRVVGQRLLMQNWTQKIVYLVRN